MKKIAEEMLQNYGYVKKEADMKGALLASSLGLGSLSPLAVNPQGTYASRFQPQESLAPLYQRLGIDPYQQFPAQAQQSAQELNNQLLAMEGKKYLEHGNIRSQALQQRPRGELFDPHRVAESYTNIFKQNPHLDPKIISKMHEAESLKNFVRKLRR